MGKNRYFSIPFRYIRKMKRIVADKAFEFSVKMVFLGKRLVKENEYVLSRQLIRSSTSISANIEESAAAASKRDFLNKMNISHKEARETKFWIRLLYRTEYIKYEEYIIYDNECDEILRILYSITRTIKEQLKNSRQ